MVKIERTPTPPPSLAVEAKKKSGKYNLDDVVEQLEQDFHSKCYLCEMDSLTNREVEHLLPHKNGTYPERKFDWDNLFLACGNCNKLKNKSEYDGKILDCCKVDPEIWIDHIYTDGQVTVKTHAEDCTDETVLQTVKLLLSCYTYDTTPILRENIKVMRKRLEETMNTLYRTLDCYRRYRSPRYMRALRAMLSREYKFAAYTRYYVRTHLDSFPELAPYVTLEQTGT